MEDIITGLSPILTLTLLESKNYAPCNKNYGSTIRWTKLFSQAADLGVMKEQHIARYLLYFIDAADKGRSF